MREKRKFVFLRLVVIVIWRFFIIIIIFTHFFFSFKPFEHKIHFPVKPKIYFPDRVSILAHFRFFTFQEENLLSSGNRESVSVEPCLERSRQKNDKIFRLLSSSSLAFICSWYLSNHSAQPVARQHKQYCRPLNLLESLEVFADQGERRNECPSSSSSYPAIKFRCV